MFCRCLWFENLECIAVIIEEIYSSSNGFTHTHKIFDFNRKLMLSLYCHNFFLGLQALLSPFFTVSFASAQHSYWHAIGQVNYTGCNAACLSGIIYCIICYMFNHKWMHDDTTDFRDPKALCFLPAVPSKSIFPLHFQMLTVKLSDQYSVWDGAEH